MSVSKITFPHYTNLNQIMPKKRHKLKKITDNNKLDLLKKRIKSHLESLENTQSTVELMEDLQELVKEKVGGMTHLGRAIGTHRQGLYRLFETGNPKLIKFNQLLDVLGYQLTIKKKK